jgi:WD40-like Beta Propeller Repeat.
MSVPCTRNAFSLLLLAVVAVFATTPVRADRIVYQQGDALYLLDEERGGAPIKLSTLGAVTGPLWALAPNGRQIAWAVRASSATLPPAPRPPAAGSAVSVGALQVNEEGEGAVPPPTAAAPTASPPPQSAPAKSGGDGLTLYVADLPDGLPKRLFATDAPRDRLDRPVTALSGAYGALRGYRLASLGWSADGKTLYLGLNPVAGGEAEKPSKEPVTVAADAATGAALVDAAGRWRVLAPLMAADACGARLVGMGAAGAMTLLDLAAGRRTTLAPPAGGAGAWSAPRDPVLAPPAGDQVAFAATPAGLYVASGIGGEKTSARRIISGDIARPRWSADGTRLFFLVPRPTAGGGRTLYDLFVAPLSAGAEATAGAPRRVYERLDTFDVASGQVTTVRRAP